MAAKLNDKQVKSLLRKSEPGRFAAGNGLYFRVSNEGTGFWVCRYTTNGKRREITLGRYGTKPGELSLAQAAAATAQLKADVKEGIDPLAEKKRPDSVKIKTVNDLAADWLTNDIEKRLKHPGIPRRVYQNDLAPVFGELSLDRVSPIDIRAAIEQIATSDRPTIANDALMYCKQLFRHGIRLNLMTSNPADAFTVHHAGGVEKSRSRALTIEELATVFQVLRENANQFTRENYLATALLLTLGVRKGELIAAKWSEFDIDAGLWNLPEERSKTGAPISVPLSSVAVEWLEELHLRACGSEFVFPNRRASKRFGHISPDTLNHALAKLFGLKVRPGKPPENKLGDAGIEHFTIHDLRRTCRTLLADAGVPGHVAERCLNHKLKGVEGIYDRYDYLDERREALQKIADQLAPIIDPMANVTSFRKGA
ncbi:tyrosine-type recombinase/integrase [Vibrio mediterranei]|uniref:tyrosine-type recombinase/integrase n=1 Tax=Vibrio mediterranei TaxID=689 RepID=UPI001EFE6CD8|nr:site-specific integrase [Vibrio mediterranei]MCG9626024.1 tyrosine-type recombinase/integrase [Vibrio mediterranei]